MSFTSFIVCHLPYSTHEHTYVLLVCARKEEELSTSIHGCSHLLAGELIEGAALIPGSPLSGFTTSVNTDEGKVLAITFGSSFIPVVETPTPLFSVLFENSTPAELCWLEDGTFFASQDEDNNAIEKGFEFDGPQCMSLPALDANIELSASQLPENGFPSVDVSMTAISDSISGFEFVFSTDTMGSPFEVIQSMPPADCCCTALERGHQVVLEDPR